MVFFKKKGIINNKKNNNTTIDCDTKFDNTKCYNLLIVTNEIVNDDVSRSIINFANFCTKNDIKVFILTGHIDIRILCDKDVEIIVNKAILNFSEKKYFKLDNSIIGILCKICSSCNIDVIDICYLWLAPIVREVALKCNIPYISTVYTMFDTKSKIDYLYSKAVIESNLIITASEYIGQFLLNKYNFDYKKMRFFPSITDKKIFDLDSVSEKRIRDVLSDIDVNIGDKRILLCFCDYSNISMYLKLIDIVKDIKANNNDFVLVFTGIFNKTKKNRNLLLKEIKNTGTEKYIRVIDAIIDRIALYALSYAVIYVDDGIFSNIHYEAMLMKKPVISIDNYLYSVNVIEKRNGFLVNKNSITDIKNAILTILNINTDKYLEMCENAYKYASSYFYKEETAQKMIADIYDLVMNYNNNHIKN